MWSSGNRVEKILFLTRLQTVWLYLLLGAIIYGWVGRLSGNQSAAMLGLAIILFDPNLLAHGALATTDLGLTAGATLCGFLFWRAWRKPGWITAAAAGVGLALLNNTKFTAGIFVVIFGLVVLGLFAGEIWRDGWGIAWRRRRPFLMAVPLVGYVALWGMYGFQIGTLPDTLPTGEFLAGRTLPLAHHLEQLLDIGNRAGKGAPAFLLGRLSDDGWWFYFLVALGVKTPLPILVLWGVGIGYWLLGNGAWGLGKRGPFSRNEAWLLRGENLFLIAPPLGFLLFSMTTSVNIGYRHIMPITPFLTVWAIEALTNIKGNGKTGKEKGGNLPGKFSLSFAYFLLSFTSLWLIAVTLWISPFPLAFFNVIAGGPAHGWHYLVDSNIDWGQNLVTLDRWLDENRPGEPVFLSYFGEGRPDYYKLPYQGLSSFPPRLAVPGADPLIPDRPVAGLYALSVTNLQGVHFADPDLLAWFRPKEPLARLGYSINLYEVRPTGEPLSIALGGGLQPRDIPKRLLDRWGTNQLDFRWFGGRSGWVVPAQSDGFILAPQDLVEFAPPCLSWIEQPDWPGVSHGNPAGCFAVPSSDGAAFAHDAATLLLLDHSLTAHSDEEKLLLTTWWQHGGPIISRKIFIHLIDENDTIVAQWDGWDVPAAGWQTGDRFFFRHEIDLPPGDRPQQVRIGVYNPGNGERWRLPDGTEALVLEQIDPEGR